ncbi:Mth938-like domain-containing protein [Allofrancisella guangzhouensis]|uniref:Membrane protein n=1 Tax=Allofrancisella guangzhouensis TaxID=594679 RepID=A0A0A8E6B7_9GAMM|nr:Mth938-like domain-containing protein [Allofrancisella guangzhouensis]AJC49504.1 membrane protein [Allofrancisella guangzhouensis]MBK2026870.1 Mth938-like domain-containing protein [Allofrancisella guangzhouensis]MBK2044049.1 Mth938-like domain-containing protein [Allofrancisella guangzhouensis]MBK2045914.1 Mth938-like domain-containing protein [Allofrancisella guangzhouensis]
MMSLQEDKITAPIFFKEYVNGSFKLNIGEYNFPLILSSTEMIGYEEKIVSVKDINKSHLEIILKTNPEIIIIGTGNKQVLPPVEIINELAKAGKSIDFMASDTACKTYNLLVNENRNVSCIII